MSAKSIFIEPSDVWLFRDSRPFAAGDQGRAVSMFPPTPRTMQGVIRSARLAHYGASFTKQSTWPQDVGTPNNYGSLKLRGPLIATWTGADVQPLFPFPEDLVKLNGDWQVLSPAPDARMKMNWPAGLQPLLSGATAEPDKFETGWLPGTDLFRYLRGKPSGLNPRASGDLFLHEPRLGIEIHSGRKRAADGMLYQIEFVRLRNDVGILCEVDGIPLPDTGLLQLGGESRAGRYQTVSTTVDLPREPRRPAGESQRRFKLYLATPAIFTQGWLPKWIDAHTLSARYDGIHMQLASAAVGKPLPIGGRDISQRDKQRKIRRAVPAGSVYFFTTDASAEDVLAAFDGRCLSDVDPEIGFGLAYVGVW